MMMNHNEPKWKTRKWWAELLGVYRDERIDQLSLVASRRSAWIAIAELGLLSGYAALQGHTILQWIALLVLLTMAGLMLHHRRYSDDIIDEFVQNKINQPYPYVGSIAIFITAYFAYLAPPATPPDFLWSLAVAVPIMVSITTLFAERAYPHRTVVSTIIFGLLGGVFGFTVAIGALPTFWIWTFGIAYLILVIISAIMYYRQ